MELWREGRARVGVGETEEREQRMEQKMNKW